MKHSKEVQTSTLLPSYLPSYLPNFLGLHGNLLGEVSLSLHPPGPPLHCATETGAWQQWCCWQILTSRQECSQKLTVSGELGKLEFI